MKNKLAATIAIAAALLTPALDKSAAHAVTTIILQPVSVTASSANDLAIRLINQSGLIADRRMGSYTSGDDFNQVVNRIDHSNFISGFWGTNYSSGQIITLTFDLGNIYGIKGLALWNDGLMSQGYGIRQFELFSDNDSIFNNGTTRQLGNTFNAQLLQSRSTGIDALTLFPAQTFSFANTSTRFVHLNILSNHGGNLIFAGEVAFEQVPFKFRHLPVVVFAVVVGGMSYFTNRKKGKTCPK